MEQHPRRPSILRLALMYFTSVGAGAGVLALLGVSELWILLAGVGAVFVLAEWNRGRRARE